MEEIIKLIDERIKEIEYRQEKHFMFCSIQEDFLNLRYIKQLKSEINFLESLKEMIIKENKK